MKYTIVLVALSGCIKIAPVPRIHDIEYIGQQVVGENHIFEIYHDRVRNVTCYELSPRGFSCVTDQDIATGTVFKTPSTHPDAGVPINPVDTYHEAKTFHASEDLPKGRAYEDEAEPGPSPEEMATVKKMLPKAIVVDRDTGF